MDPQEAPPPGEEVLPVHVDDQTVYTESAMALQVYGRVILGDSLLRSTWTTAFSTQVIPSGITCVEREYFLANISYYAMKGSPHALHALIHFVGNLIFLVCRRFHHPCYARQRGDPHHAV
jgi:hypothetical protein